MSSPVPPISESKKHRSALVALALLPVAIFVVWLVANEDLTLVISSSLVQLVITWYGVDVALEKHNSLAAAMIGGLGLVGVGFTAASAYRSDQAQKRMQAQIDQIRKNTEQHSHMEIDPIGPPRENSDLRVGAKPAMNIEFRNVGEYNLTVTSTGVLMFLFPRPRIAAIFDEYSPRLEMNNLPIKLTPRTAKAPYHTYQTAVPLTAIDLKRINSGELDVCTIWKVIWEDSTGSYSTDGGTCFGRDSGGNFNHAVIKENGRETRLSSR